MKSLIVDDNNDVLRLLGVLMNSTEQEVDTISNVIQGLEMILKNEYDLVLLDLTMPEFSGFSIVDKLAEVGKKQNLVLYCSSSIRPGIVKMVQTWN
jgi:DNA-binding response OmpR family regulator